MLQLASDGRERTIRDGMDAIARSMNLSKESLEEKLPSGVQTRFYNRFGWALTYLRRAGLLESPKRGFFCITDRGREVLKENPSRIDLNYLKRFPEIEEFRKGENNQNDAAETDSTTVETDQTPEEIIEAGYKSLNRELAAELLDRIKECPPDFFERLVVDLLVRMGYGGSRADAGRAIGRSGDDGVDGIIKEDRLGLDAVYIQAKRWESNVGRPQLQAFAGSLEGNRARKGVMITTSRFSQDAVEYIGRIEKRIVLIDGNLLAALMIEHGVGVSPVAEYTICRIDNDYFEQGE